MRIRLTLSLAVLGLIAACISSRTEPSGNVTGECRIPLTATLPGSTLIVIKNFAFQPAEVRIKPGNRVTWVNCDGDGQPAHTATGDQGQFDSGSLVAGQAFQQVFAQAGRFAYHCEPHPFMTGTIIVE